MKPLFYFSRNFCLLFLLLLSLNSLSAQEEYFCDGVDSPGGTRSHFGCPDLDELTAEEVQAMPIMYIPVVFHFRAYRDTLAHQNVNFICDTLDPLYAINYDLYAPRFVYYAMKEMNERMSDQLLESATGDISSDRFDTRIRYYLYNGPDWTTLLEDPDCSSFNFYGVGQSPGAYTSLPFNAVHIVVRDNGSEILVPLSSPTGGEAFRPHVIELKNFTRAYFRKPSYHNTWSPGRVNNHEIGHLFDLDHTFNCLNICRISTIHPDNPIDPALHCCDTCYIGNDNPPSGFPPCTGGACSSDQAPFLMGQQYLTVTLCEHRIWWSEKTNSPYPFVDYCNDSSRVEELVYDTGTKLTWSGERLINADVTIKNGTEIEITCDVFMGKNKRIIVERGARLTVNGGSISGLCDEKWQGIIVEGVSDSLLLATLGNRQLLNYDDALDPDLAGTIVIIDGSVSDAKSGISTYNSQYSWPTIKDYYGGLIYCDNAHFFDCNRAVEFMKYGQGVIKDKSHFVDCTFEDLGRGVTIWANNGVSFNSSEFNNAGLKGILAYDSEILVEDSCRFHNNLNALELFSTYPNPFGHRIGSLSTRKNVFLDNHYAIYGNSQGNTKALIVENNRFEENDYGIFLGGQSHFTINSNHFEGMTISQEIAATGDDENLITRNYIEDNKIGTSYVYNNVGSSFLHNCYVDIDTFDVLLNHTKVFPLMGSSSSSAGNCFTKNSTSSIYCNTNEAAVKYYSFGTGLSCYYPIISNCSNVSRETSANLISINCDPIDNPIASPIDTCPIPVTNSGKLSGISTFDGLISSTQASSSYTSQQKVELIAGYRKCQSTLIHKFVENQLANSTVPFMVMVDSLVTYLDARPEFKYKMQAYGLKVYSSQYADALYYLNRLSTSNEEERDFVTVQKINLDYLQDIVNYSPTSGLLDTLYDIGMKTHPYTGYARSLYHQLTDELIQFDIPDIEGVILPRSIESKSNDLVINSYPNPLHERTYNIEFKGAKDLGLVKIEIFDMMGKSVLQRDELVMNDGIVQLDTQGWLFGVFIITVRSVTGELLYTSKFTKLN